MRVLIIHHEAEYFAGAEKMLDYYLQGPLLDECTVAVAAVAEGRVREIIPAGLPVCWLPPNAKLSAMHFWRQVRTVFRYCREQRIDVIHGWAARNWELCAVASRLTGIPAVGTLHDHPRATFISRGRQRLMAWSAAA